MNNYDTKKEPHSPFLACAQVKKGCKPARQCQIPGKPGRMNQNQQRGADAVGSPWLSGRKKLQPIFCICVWVQIEILKKRRIIRIHINQRFLALFLSKSYSVIHFIWCTFNYLDEVLTDVVLLKCFRWGDFENSVTKSIKSSVNKLNWQTIISGTVVYIYCRVTTYSLIWQWQID